MDVMAGAAFAKSDAPKTNPTAAKRELEVCIQRRLPLFVDKRKNLDSIGFARDAHWKEFEVRDSASRPGLLGRKEALCDPA